MIIQELIKINPTKLNHYAILDKTIPNFAGIYLLFDKRFNLIYIGKSRHIRHRLVIHTSKNTNLRYKSNEDLEYGCNSLLPLNVVKYYSLIKIQNEEERNIKEQILISILKPKYNNLRDKKRR